MNEQSLRDSNALLAAAGSRTEVGGFIPGTPADLARDSGVSDRLSVARAVRALMARGRIAQEGNRYRLLDAKPLEAGEPASVRRPIKRRRKDGASPDGDGVDPEAPTYEGVGKAVIDRLIELTASSAEQRAALDRARSEAEAARREAVEVNRRAADDRRRVMTLEDEVNTLKRRLEMTEANLRTMVEAAKNRPASPLEDTDAKAILDILSAKETSE